MKTFIFNILRVFIVQRSVLVIFFIFVVFDPSMYAQEYPQTTKLTIAVSGPVKYQHYQMDHPPRLIIKFKSRNIFSPMAEHTIIEQGAVKSINVEYDKKRPRNKGGNIIFPLKSLSFELSEKSPYKISEAKNMIIVEIENSVDLKSKELSIGEIELLSEREEAYQQAMTEALIRLEEITEGNDSESEVPEIRDDFEQSEGVSSLPIFQPALDKKKINKISVPNKDSTRGFFKEGNIVLEIFSLLCMISVFFLYRHRSQYFTNLSNEIKEIVSEEKELEYQLHGFEHIEKINPTILNELVLKNFEQKGYRISAIEDDKNSQCIISFLERDNDKVLSQYLYKDDYYDHVLVENFEKLIKQKGANKGYIVTPGAFTLPAIKFAQEKSIELIGKEKIAEFVYSYLEKAFTLILEKNEDSKNQLIKKDSILEEERRYRQQLDQKLDQSDKELKVQRVLVKNLMEEKVQKDREFLENETVLKEANKTKENLVQEVESKDELLNKLKVENQRLLDEKDKHIKEIVTPETSLKRKPIKRTNKKKDLKQLKRINTNTQEDDRILRTKKEDLLYPSLDLTSLGDRGVLLRIEPKGPIVTLKRIGLNGVYFKSSKRINIPSLCNMTLIFFGSLNSLIVKGKVIRQQKTPGRSNYNVWLGYHQLRKNDKNKIKNYINKIKRVDYS